MIMSTTVLLAGLLAEKRLMADLFVTNQPGSVFMSWRQGRTVELSSVKTARRGEPVAALVLFSECAGDKQGNCDVRMDMVILDPAGKVYGESKDTEVWSGKAAPSPGTSQLGVGYMMVRIEPKDPAGTYRIKAHVTDRIRKTDLDRERSFEVAPLTAADSATWPADHPKPSLAGFWKEHCDDGFGLKIELAGGELYSISFCGPGGCFEPGTYRPNSPIFGDELYRVRDADRLEVLGGDGFSTYYRCPTSSPK
jgi:hypothetical protein